jgi:hypothetical protein
MPLTRNPTTFSRTGNRVPTASEFVVSRAASTAQLGTVETDVALDTTATVPAGRLKVGSVIRVRAQGIHTLTTGAETHTMALKIGSTTVASQAAIDPADNDLFYFDAVFVIRTIGASGTFVATGAQAHGVPGTVTAKPFLKASTAIDTTVDQIVGVYIDRQGTATDTDSCRLDILFVEVLG